jgi:hypothetical protein
MPRLLRVVQVSRRSYVTDGDERKADLVLPTSEQQDNE